MKHLAIVLVLFSSFAAAGEHIQRDLGAIGETAKKLIINDHRNVDRSTILDGETLSSSIVHEDGGKLHESLLVGST